MLAKDKAGAPKVAVYSLSRTVQSATMLIVCCPACMGTRVRWARIGAVVKTGGQDTRRLLSAAAVM